MAEPALPTPTAVILDLDGTLVDTVPTRIAAWLQVFGEFAIPAERAHVASLIGSDGKFLAEEVARAAGRELQTREADRIDRRSGVIYSALNTEPRLLPGVAELLAEIEGRGLAWAIATSSLAAQVTSSVEALGLADPPVIVDGSGVRRAKPAPDLLLAAARALDQRPADCWYVGDATWDMLSANSAGMVPIGVTTGAATTADLVATGALVVVADLDAVRALL